MAKKSYINYVLEISNALNDILKSYPLISPDQVQRFVPIYYPIAMIEMVLDEITFEDFESIQLTVLALVDAGITDPEVISATMGMDNPLYIEQVLQLLKGYGHISDGKLTALGTSSLAEGKKIRSSRVWQQFQMDALSGNLLEIDENLISESLVTSNETQRNVPLFSYLEGISSSQVESQIKRMGIDHFMQFRSSILNSNVQHIERIRCLEIKYARCYLMKMNSSEHSIVFGKRKNPKGNTLSEKYYWAPFSVHPESRRYFPSSSVPFSADGTEYTDNIAELLKKALIDIHDVQDPNEDADDGDAKKNVGTPNAAASNREKNGSSKITLREDKPVDLAAEIQDTIHKWMPSADLSEGRIRITNVNKPRIAYLKVQHTDFKKYRKSLFHFLEALARWNMYLLSNLKLKGRLISISTKDPVILKVVEAYRQVMKREDYRKVIQDIQAYFIENNLEDLQGEELFQALWERLTSPSSTAESVSPTEPPIKQDL